MLNLETVRFSHTVFCILNVHFFVKEKINSCVSLAIMSPLTAKVKCPHYGRQTNLESEAVKAVASSEDGA